MNNEYSFSCMWCAYVCMYVCMFVGTHVQRCTHTHMEVWGQMCQLLLHLTQWGRVSQSNPEFINMAHLPSQVVLGIPSLLFKTGIIGRPPSPLGILCGFWELKLWSSCWHSKQVTCWTISPVHAYICPSLESQLTMETLLPSCFYMLMTHIVFTATR